MKTKFWNGFTVGDKVLMAIETRGATCHDEELTYPAGTLAVIAAVSDFGPLQGMGVDVTIGDDEQAIVNSFDDRDIRDLGYIPFEKVRP